MIARIDRKVYSIDLPLTDDVRNIAFRFHMGRRERSYQEVAEIVEIIHVTKVLSNDEIALCRRMA